LIIEGRHCEEPTDLAFGEPDGKLLDEAIQGNRFLFAPGLLRCARNDAFGITLESPPL